MRDQKDPHPVDEPRFGLRVPLDGSPAPFRVLVNVRWLWAGLVGLVAFLVTLVRVPRHLRLPLVLSGVLAGLSMLVTAIVQARQLAVEHVTIPIDDLPPALDGFTIIQLSDFHLGSPFSAANLQRAIAWMRRQQPDLVVLTGDFVSYTDNLPLLHEGLQDLSAHHGIYAILGNHDYWTDIAVVEQALARHSIELLRNEQRCIDVGGSRLYLVGIDCVWEAQHDLELALSSIADDGPVVVLAHEPDIADEIAAYGPALQLSGHTHAGHITLPGLGPLFLPRHGFRYFRGLHRVGRMWLYVSRGLGGAPLRLGCPPEATMLRLRAAPRSGSDERRNESSS